MDMVLNYPVRKQLAVHGEAESQPFV